MKKAQASFNDFVNEMDLVTQPIELESIHHNSFALAHHLRQQASQIETKRL